MKPGTENQAHLVEALKSLGLTKYEALVYIALLRVPSATASGIHESSSVPRASVYPVLDQLLGKGLVSVSLSSPKMFAAVPPDDAVARLMGRIERDAGTARKELVSLYRKRIEPAGGGELIWNLHGLDTVRKKLADLISGANSDVRILAHPDIVSGEVQEMLTSRSGQLSVEIVTPGTASPGSGHAGPRADCPPDPLTETGRDLMSGGICIIDRKKILVIMGSGPADTVALYSESEGFVSFFVRYFHVVTGSTQTGSEEEPGQLRRR